MSFFIHVSLLVYQNLRKKFCISPNFYCGLFSHLCFFWKFNIIRLLPYNFLPNLYRIKTWIFHSFGFSTFRYLFPVFHFYSLIVELWNFEAYIGNFDLIFENTYLQFICITKFIVHALVKCILINFIIWQK